MRIFAALLSFALCALLAVPVGAEKAGIQVKDPWVRQAFPGAKVMAGYMTLLNKFKLPLTLVDASSKDFRSVTIHRTVMQGGMVRMQQQTQIRIAPGKTIEFKPGSYHLMLMQPKKSFRYGDSTKVILHFAGGTKRTIVFRIKQGEGKSHKNHHR